MTIEHRAGTYPVDFLTLEAIVAEMPHDCFVVSDQNLQRLYRGQFPDQANWIVVPPGESSKSLEVYGQALRQLAQRRASRRSTLVAFGGGVVGDLAGFLAASYLRGVPFIQIPTTLLSQVDSSVGGKVGIDLPEGKNLVGAFYPPSRVMIPLEALQTLPEREFLNGCAEVLKYGLIMDQPLWDQLAEPLTPNSETLPQIVAKCIQLKAQVVAEDEFETTGRRAILNFGHTVGHALEHHYKFHGLLHGEAIAVGMVVEARLGEALGLTPAGTANQIAERFVRWGLPVQDPAQTEVDQLVEAMRRDKKAVAGNLAFSLLSGIGACKLVENVEEGAVRRALVHP